MKQKSDINFSSFFRDLFLAETECTISFAIIGTIFARLNAKTLFPSDLSLRVLGM